MQYTFRYESPLGGILLAADEVGLTGLWFEGAKYFAAGLDAASIPRETPALARAMRWLDAYFRGEKPDCAPALHPAGTPFQRAVWARLLEIPYGGTATYGEIAAALTRGDGGAPRHACAQAVGGAVGRNPISLIVPCHRVVGADGSLTGYAGGLDRKLRLLELEGADTSALWIPEKRTAQ